MLASSIVSLGGVFAVGALILLVLQFAADGAYEGFGSRTVGGGKGPEIWVDPQLGDPVVDPKPGYYMQTNNITSFVPAVPVSSDGHAGTKDNPCSLRKALAGGDRVIKFTRGGTITLAGDIRITESCVTIDGASAAPGITITHTHEAHGGIIIGSPGKHIHDFIVSHLRFGGLFHESADHKVGYRLLMVSARDNEGGKISNVLFDHLTMRYLQDKTTYWGNLENVTVSWSMFYGCVLAQLVSFYNYPYDLERKGITFHHNLFAHNEQRNPQLRGWINDLEYVNNIVHDWEFYGMRIKNEPGEKSVNANVMNNHFSPGKGPAEAALIYGWDPGADDKDGGPAEDLPQGAVYKGSKMGKLWVAGNILPPQNRDHYSTIDKPLDIPAWARVKRHEAKDLAAVVLPDVGMKYRDDREKGVVEEVATAMKNRT